MRVTRTDWGVALTDDRGLEVDLVEHLLAAFAGLGIRRGVAAIVEGPEVPILDGGSRRFADALASFGIPEMPPELVVARAGRLALGASSYEFEPSETVDVTVETHFDHPAIGRQEARWDGSAETFRDQIAPARTFGFANQAAALTGRGRAGLAARLAAGDAGAATLALREAVVIFDESPVAYRLLENETAKHKLLDLIGDFALYGGPPRGRVVARRPGHTATHRIVQQALASGILSER
jgi:UDP-3-O-[3-hydroxymyristoyl] N-acetylglucosamine deacetylase